MKECLLVRDIDSQQVGARGKDLTIAMAAFYRSSLMRS